MNKRRRFIAKRRRRTLRIVRESLELPRFRATLRPSRGALTLEALQRGCAAAERRMDRPDPDPTTLHFSPLADLVSNCAARLFRYTALPNAGQEVVYDDTRWSDDEPRVLTPD